MDVFQIVQNTIKEHNLICPGDRILAALSGGSDSVTLLYILHKLSKQMNFYLAAAHVNHCLRSTAQRDMEFSENLCNQLGIPFYSKTCDVKSGAKKNKMSEELYARNVRYSFFSSLGFDKIATAHNKNDSAETILFHFIRGCSINGLCGIPYKRDNIIRPLLDVKKDDIENFCIENGYKYVTDETNFQPIYSRNIIRLELIPEIEDKLNKGFTNVITSNAELFREDDKFLEKLAEDEYKIPLTAKKINALPSPVCRRLIQLHFKKSAGTSENLSSLFIKDIIELCKKNKTGQSISLPCGYEARTEYGNLIIAKKENKTDFEYNIYPNQLLKIPETGKTIIIYESPDGDIHLESTDGLTVRNRRKGDIFYPEKMTGKKKLSDYFTDKKIPRLKRSDILLLAKDGEIVSVIGMRNDRRFTDSAKPAYKIEIKEDNNAEQTY